MEGKKLYHGTCRAFVQLAMERGRHFGPEYDRISFTPNYKHAKMFAESWKTPIGRLRLEEFFGKLPEELYSPVILKFNTSDLGNLIETMDAGAIEFYIEKGPIKLPKLIK